MYINISDISTAKTSDVVSISATSGDFIPMQRTQSDKTNKSQDDATLLQ